MGLETLALLAGPAQGPYLLSGRLWGPEGHRPPPSCLPARPQLASEGSPRLGLSAGQEGWCEPGQQGPSVVKAVPRQGMS